MDSSAAVRSRDPLARRIVGRSNVVRTDLSPSQSVNAAETVAGLHHAPVEAGRARTRYRSQLPVAARS